MKNKLAKYQNEYIIFFVEVFFLFFFIKGKKSNVEFNIKSNSKVKETKSLTNRSTHFLAPTTIPLLSLEKRRIKSSIKSKEFIF